MILKVLALGFILSQDNFRTSIALGALRLRWPRAVQVALVFGLCDAAAPLVGLLVGQYVAQGIGSMADYVGPVVLAGFGLYLVVQGLRGGPQQVLDHRWSLFSLPLPLSLDNLIAGTGLGLLDFSPWLSAVVFGAITALMSLVGLQLGRAASRLIPVRVRGELLSGVALIVIAVLLALRL
jgi:manganese efflux pump family protein